MDYPVADRQLRLARQWLATPVRERRPVPARRSATVALVRDGRQGLECYLQWRPATMRFAAGVAVFAGGAAEPADEDLGVTAIRELFEETGVLLADPVRGDPAPQDLDRARARLEAGAAMSAVAADLGVRLRPDLLVWWMRRVTPEFEPYRYDTTFFVTAARAGDDPRPLTGESVRGTWAGCAQALADGTALMAPTKAALASLAELSSVAELAVAVRNRTPVMSALVEGSEPPRLTPGARP